MKQTRKKHSPAFQAKVALFSQRQARINQGINQLFLLRKSALLDLSRSWVCYRRYDPGRT